MEPRRRKSVWGAIGAVLGGVGIEVGHVAVDAVSGAGLGALRAVMDGRIDKASILTGACAGAALGVGARYGLDKIRERPQPEDPPMEYRDGGDR